MRVQQAMEAFEGGSRGWAEVWQPMLTLFTHSLLHGSLEHLASNLFFFWMFAGLVGRLLGSKWVFLVFPFTAILGGIVHLAMNWGEPIPMLGASGGVMGFEGAYLGLAVRWRLPDPFIWPMSRPVPPAHLALLAAIGFGLDYRAIISGFSSGIAYGAHLGGFAGGLLLATLFLPKPRMH